MGRASGGKGSPDRRARIAAQREAEQRRQRQRRIYLAAGAIAAVAIVVVVLVYASGGGGGGTAPTASNGPTGAALAKLTGQVTGVPASVTDKIGGDSVPSGMFVPAKTSSAIQSAATSLGSYFATVDGKQLTKAGKPEILYLGADFCPYCAAQRWAVINALSRFGTFTGLTTTYSSTSDVFPNTPTYTFYGSTYTSKYIAFTPVEEAANYRQGHSASQSVPYVKLQTPTAAQNALSQAYNPSGAIPFLDLGNKYVQVGNLTPLNPKLLQGKTWEQVGAALSDPASPIAQAVIGNANYLTAAICTLTGNQPASACTPAVRKLQSTLAK